MLLNYLYSTFQEEAAFAKSCATSAHDLHAKIAAHTFPAPSYIYTSQGQSTSFVATFTEQSTYRFHLPGHAAWFQTLEQLGLHSQTRARAHFESRYEQSKTAFLSGDLGQQLTGVAPQIPARFDRAHGDTTWGHFLNGVYGVCTRNGLPETIFLKQICVLFIEEMIATGPGSLCAQRLELLNRTVDFLDRVESDFAPHETPNTSRQRCIIDVRARFFNHITS